MAAVLGSKPGASIPHNYSLKEIIQCGYESAGSPYNCRHEDPNHKEGANALPFLHSTWITDDIVASARYSQKMILEQNLVEEMKRVNIGSIINLQTAWEHGLCGPGVLPDSGFSYDPECFTTAGIEYYNFPANDMSAPPVQDTQEIVEIIDKHIKKGEKVGVHCHAGKGRTGMIIACYLVYTGMSVEEAIEHVRKRRAGSVQTETQVQHVHLFKAHAEKHRSIQYAAPVPHVTMVAPERMEASKNDDGYGVLSGEAQPPSQPLLPQAVAPTPSGGCSAWCTRVFCCR